MENESLIITQETVSDGIKFALQGRLDSNSAGELDRTLQGVARVGQNSIILNMHHVEYLCSSGIRVLLKAYRTALAAGGKFGIEKPSECVKSVLGLVSLNEMVIA